MPESKQTDISLPQKSFPSKEEKELLTAFDLFYKILLEESGQSKFERYIKSSINYLYRLFTPVIANRGTSRSCDFLVIHFFNRKLNFNFNVFCKDLENTFKKENIHFHKLLSPGKQLSSRSINVPPLADFIPLDCYYFAPYAAFLIKHYQPKLIITFLEWNPLAIPLYIYAHQMGCKVINIAHAMTSNSLRCSIFSFDYYFVLGATAVNNMNKNRTRIGNTKLIQTGYINLNRYFTSSQDSQESILYFSDWLAPGFEPIIKANMQLVAEWAKKYNRPLRIKLHPHENAKFVQEIFSENDNIEILDREISIQDALRTTSVSILSWSSAALESAVMGCPIVVANLRPDLDNDFLNIQDHFGIAAKTPAELEKGIQKTLDNYSHYYNQCEIFAEKHLAFKQSSEQKIIDYIKMIYDDIEPEYTPIGSTL